MAWYRSTSKRLTLAPEGDELELDENSVLVSRLLAGGFIAPISEEDSAEQRNEGTAPAAPAGADSDLTASGQDTDSGEDA